MLLKYVSVAGRGSGRGIVRARECTNAFCYFDLSFVLNFYLTFNAGIAGIFCQLTPPFAFANLLRSSCMQRAVKAAGG